MDIKSILSVSLILFSVIDILGSIPIIIELKSKGREIESFKASIIAGVIMIAFLLFGENILKLLGVDVSSFAIAGSLIIFFLGIEMILGITLFRESESGNNKSTVFPIAFPLIAGAGTMTTIISLKSEYSDLSIITGIVINVVFVYIVLKSSNWIQRKIGRSGEMILRKVFGIILIAIAVRLFKTNLMI